MNQEKVPRCTGGYNCEPAKKERLIYFASKAGLDIDGLGRETIETLIANNLVSKFEDFYSLEYNQLIVLPQWKEKKTRNLLNAIEKSKNADIERILPALGIRYIGKQTSKLLINTFGSIKEVFSASFDEINSIHGISDSVSNSIFEWYSNDENKKLINNLENIGLKISEKLQSNSGNLNGKTFVLTGTLNNLTCLLYTSDAADE